MIKVDSHGPELCNADYWSINLSSEQSIYSGFLVTIPGLLIEMVLFKIWVGFLVFWCNVVRQDS